MVAQNVSNDWEKVLTSKPIDRKITSGSVEWIFEMLGWKKNARRTN